MQFFENAEEYMKRCGISEVMDSAPAVLCAYSGGADSSVLLHFLSAYVKKNGKTLFAAHMNHMIRGDDADADERFCRECCRQLGIELFVEKKDVPAEAKEAGEGLEECARRLRYDFLRETAKSLGGAVIVTAHNATDNMETVIFNLARGTSVHGLGGIAPVSGGNIVRPLLFASSEEIRKFAESSGISYVTDKTNFDTDYTRNLIRHTVVPNLRKINSDADGAFLRLSRSAREDDEYLTRAAEKFAGDRRYIPRKEFAALERPVASRVILLLCSRESGRKNISEKNISDCLDFVCSGKIGSISIHGCDFFAHSDAVFIKSRKAEKTVFAPVGDFPLETGKFTEFGDFSVGVFEKESDITPLSENIYNLFIQQVLNRDRIYGNLFVRTRRPGDTFFFHGKHRKLKKLMCDEKIPQRIRDSLPLICDESGIVLVPTLSDELNEKCDGNVLHIIIFRKKEHI